MRTRLLGLFVVLTLGLACRSPKSVPEEGAVLLRVSCAVTSPPADELRVWAYHDGGRLWDGARVPEEGSLNGQNPADLGTILIAPGAIQGALRIHIRALAAGERLADGMITIPTLASGERTYDFRLESTVPADDDGDGVPDAIDDCVGVANANQGGCAAAPKPDAGGDAVLGPPVDSAVTTPVDAEPRTDAAQNVDTSGGVKLDADTKTGDAPIDGPANIPDSKRSDLGTQVTTDSGKDSAADQVPLDVAVPADSSRDVTVVRDVSVPVDIAVDSFAGDAPAGDACGSECNKTQGELCAQNDECASGFCADGVCCTNSCSGPCRSCSQPDSTGICRGYATGSDPEVECTGGAKCNGAGACGTTPPPLKPNGQLCGAGSECLSGFCSDGMCCNEACDQPCEACGSGTCKSVTKTEDKPECSDTMTCNRNGKCVAKSS
jgi:hypothetical protein